MVSSADHVIETFQTAAEENKLLPGRYQQMVYLPEEGEVWMTGDLHDHRRNFDKLIRAADLANNPHRHLVLHELIHGEFYDPDGADSSWQTLFRAAELKCDFPEQVHFLLANHDLAQIHGEGIMKAGQSVCEAFNAGLRKAFEEETTKVNFAMSEFLLSLPLAIRCPNGVFFCHSLPADDQIDKFDYSVFEREELNGTDYRRRTGPVYQLIWGRNFSPATVEKFAEAVEASIIVTGHQPQDQGFAINGPRHLILASDHNHGVFLPFELSEEYDLPALVKRIRRIAALE